ncbi:MAG: 1-acyl-sn-glycerol-3-phosphate acyltransferase [Sulfurimonas sp.]|nr:1-acyl-sn-glycerol-3-phosphate acyltransferase [Sulfurimonas sp.]
MLKCIIGSFAHFLFFGFIVLLIPPATLIYIIARFFTKDLEWFFQKSFALSNKIFFILVPKIVLKLDIPKELPHSAIYISTHQSILDYPILTLFVKRYIMLAKINLDAVPLVAFFSNLVGVKFLGKKKLDEVSRIYKELESVLNEDKSLILFPEGTRHVGRALEPFKRGAFKLSMKTGKPIVPVVIEGLTKILPRKSFCFKTNKKTVVHVKMLEPIYAKDFINDRELLKYAQKIMQQEKDRLCDIS